MAKWLKWLDQRFFSPPHSVESVLELLIPVLNSTCLKREEKASPAGKDASISKKQGTEYQS
jgi:hypothetical protein